MTMKTAFLAGALCALSVLNPPECPAQQSADLPGINVDIPKKLRPLPEPLPEGRTEPGFAVRGIKGWMWHPEQYLAEIPVLAAYRMNFLMNCYTSMCDIEHYAWGAPECNRWWEPLPDAKKKAYEEVVRSCAMHGIQFCFSMNPNLTSSRFADPDKPEDVESLYQHYRWMQGLGVKWFNISLDDISQGIDAERQARLVNGIFRRLRSADSTARMIFCPTYYWGDGTDSAAGAYLRALSSALDKDIIVFWTGDGVVTPRITRRAAESYRKIVGHRMFLWDNYPVNDNNPTMHLGPLTGRDSDLSEVIDGYMSNPLCPQDRINRVPLGTCADYAYNPWSYDPARSIGQSILRVARTKRQQEIMKDIVEAYPGMLLFNKGTGYNPVRERFLWLSKRPHGKSQLRPYIVQMEKLLKSFRSAFGSEFPDCAKTIADDVVWMNAEYSKMRN
jgi:hypothetical protein